MEIVRSKTGAAAPEDFRNATGSPIVIDQTPTTGRVYFVDSAGNIREVGGVLSLLAVSGQITSTLATGTPPFVIASTTEVANLNVALLKGANWAAPGSIGSTTPAAGAFTTLSASGLISANGGQIKFPATAVPSSDVNTLDDYEEGTWTPVDSSGASLTFTSASGSYTKVGRLVYVNAVVVYPITASGANALIGGLPFTVGALNAVGSCYSTSGTVLASLGAATTTLVVPVTAATGVARTNAQMSGTTLAFTMSYEV